MTEATAGLVVIGGSHAGHQIAIAARNAGYEKPVTILSDEDTAPYQRPPLSKAYLLGKVDAEALLFRPVAYYEGQGIDLRLGAPAISINRPGKTVTTAAGEAIPYEKLALATGARVREIPIPGADLPGVHYIRTLADIDGVSAELGGVETVLVVGGGFIGLEAAAALRVLGKKVIVLEALDRLMARGVGETVSSYFADYHHAQGVDLRLSTGVQELTGEERLTGARLGDGSEVQAELAIIGIGVLPNQELASAAGLDCDNGVLVDQFGTTSDPDIFAAGDCTRFTHPFTGELVRLESVQNASDQARTVGAAIAGKPSAYDAAPWFWSDQFDLKLQMVGLTQGHDREVLIGSQAENAFSVFYFRGETWLGADSVNRAGDHMAARRLYQQRYPLTEAELRENADNLKGLVKALRKG